MNLSVENKPPHVGEIANSPQYIRQVMATLFSFVLASLSTSLLWNENLSPIKEKKSFNHG
jgi:hypothetical protein